MTAFFVAHYHLLLDIVHYRTGEPCGLARAARQVDLRDIVNDPTIVESSSDDLDSIGARIAHGAILQIN